MSICEPTACDGMSAAPKELLRCECGRGFATTHHLQQHQDSCCELCPVPGNAANELPRGRNRPTGVRDEKSSELLRLARLRLHHSVPREALHTMRQTMKQHVESLHAELQAKIECRLGSQAAEMQELASSVFETAADLGARDSELDLLRASKAYVKPVRRYLGTCPNSGEAFFAYDGAFDKNMEGLLAEHWEEIKTSAAKMHTGGQDRKDRKRRRAGSEVFEVTDLWDGLEFKEFMVRVAIRPGQTPLVFMFYYDGLEVVNGLGQARTTHEMGCFYWACLNLGQEVRLSSRNIRLATVCYKRAITICGMDCVVAGPSKEGEGRSWVNWMIALDSGLKLQTPEGRRIFRGGTALVAADTPAAAELVGTKKAVGPSTKSICRNCHCWQNGGAHRKACSFLPSLPEWKRCVEAVGRSQTYTLRSAKDLCEYIKLLQAVKAGTASYDDLHQWMQQQGVNTFHGALWKLPHWDYLTGCPMDMMHVWLEGVARQGLGAVSYWLKATCKANLFQIPNEIAREAQKQGLPRADFPYLNTTRIEHLGEGATGGIPSADCSFPGTAAQIGKLLLHLPAILGPLVPKEKRGEQVWQVALLMAKIHRLLWKRTLSKQDILELDNSIWLHDTTFLHCPTLQHLWKPKNHYLSHLPLDIVRWGPPRMYWCMNFEHENQVSKEGASGNFINPVWSLAEHKSLLVSLDYMEKQACMSS